MKEDSLNILYIDDRDDLLGIVEDAAVGHHVRYVQNSLRALDEFRSDRFDLVITDIFMPYVDGFQVYKQIRQFDNLIPIIFLSVDDSHLVVSRGLRLEYAQFVSRKISTGHLQALIDVSLESRRNRESGFEIDLKKNQVNFKDQIIPLTPIEIRILECLTANGMRVAKGLLKDKVWSDVYVNDRTLQTHIGNLRQKLAPLKITVRTGRDGYVEINF